ncbi:F-box only protein 4-like [Watersipora subatra]|uniref:F-box only protein 4-like n=1 Tax=Watersipora subatra TaxID=2589382 RepID=UPI00355B3C9B
MDETRKALSVSDLPDDILLHVFSFLDALSLCKVRRVCKRWNHLSTDEILWKHKLLTDVKSWKHVSNAFTEETGNADESTCDMYLKNSPEIQTWKREFYQRTTLHQLTNLLRNFLPTKKFAFGVGASAMDSFGKGRSFFSKLLSFDSANVFQHCGEFPGRFRGAGGGFQFKYKRHMLELCLMYLAPKLLREAMTVEQKIEQLKKMMESTGYSELLTSLKGYIHTIDSRILEGVTEKNTIEVIQQQSEEVLLIDAKLKPDIPMLILSVRKVEADPHISPYEISKSLRLNTLSRPWMVCECSAEMIYRDVVDGMDWLIGTATPLL